VKINVFFEYAGHLQVLHEPTERKIILVRMMLIKNLTVEKGLNLFFI